MLGTITITVGQRETTTAILKEESVEKMETKASESSETTKVDGKQKGAQGADKLSPSSDDKAEEQGQPSESLSNDVGFKKVFKLVGFKFTVRKDKTEKVEPVQLLNVKADEAGVASSGAGDCKEIKTETTDEATQSEVLRSVEKSEQETQTDQKKEECLPETTTESPAKAESKQEEVKNNGSQSPESPTSPVTTETASPLRKFFAQGWAGFRKKTSFRKSKEEEQQVIEKEKDQEEEIIKEETTVSEELEKEKPIPEKDQTEISMEVSDDKAEKEKEEKEETKMVEVSTETHEDVATPHEELSTKESDECEIKELEINLKEKVDLASAEESTQTEEHLMALGQSTPAPPKKEPETTALLRGEASEGITDQSELTSPMAIEQVEEPFEIVEADKSETGAPVATDTFDEKSTEMSTDSSTTGEKKESKTTPKEELVLKQLVETGTDTFDEKSTEMITDSCTIEEKEESKTTPKEELVVKQLVETGTDTFDDKFTEMSTDSCTIEEKEESKTTPKEELVVKQLVETGTDIQSWEPTDEQLTVKETSPEVISEHLKQIESNTINAATSKPPEAITNEAELLSSQERAKIQGSPLKKLFTSSSLKKLSGKKRKGKKEEVKSGEAGEQIQQLSDSAESPEDPRGESSASSPEEATESVEKVDASQITETEESTFDVEKKRESVTPWASFKKMVTPKKRVRRLSESDKEDELDKAKNATLSSTESGPGEEQEDSKESGEEQKLEKSTEEPKRKVDTSVSWEALICVGSSKRRSRKSSSSDEEVGQRLAQEGQKIDEGVPNKDLAPEATLTSSQESDQGQGNSSPEQVGSPSEGEGVSTWESFKRLVTPRRKSKTRMEERSEDTATVPSLEHSTSDTDSGKEESWVSFKKLMPGRRKKKSDGVPEHAPVQESGEEIAETNEEDYDVPAVVPLSEYEAAEQEKFEAQVAKQDMTEKDKEQEKPEDSINEQSNEGLIHAVTVTVVEGEKAVTSIEERSPSWISAAVTESTEHANEDEEKHTEHISGTGVVEETVVDTKLMPEIKKDVSGDTIVSELTSEAITAREEPSGVEEGTEMSCAEETTEMVSAVSRLSESPDTTEIATPVQEVEEDQQNLEELNKQTQEILQEVAERVKVTDEAPVISESMLEEAVQPVSVEKMAVIVQGAELSEMLFKEEVGEKTDIQTDGGIESVESQVEIKENDLKEVLEKQKDVCMEVTGSAEVTSSLDRTDASDHPKIEKEVVEESEKSLEKQMSGEKSEDEEDFVIVTVTPEEEQEVTVGDTIEKQQVLKEAVSGEYGPADTVQEVKMNVEATTAVVVIDGPKADELMKAAREEKPQFSQKEEKVVCILPNLKSEPMEQSTIEIKKLLMQDEVQDADVLIESPHTEEFVLEAPIQSKIVEVSVKGDETKIQDLDVARDAVLGVKTGSAEEITVEACIQSKENDVCVEMEMHAQKMEPESSLQKLETKISMKDMESESLLVKLEEQVHAETVEKEVSIRKLEVDVHKQNAVAEDHTQETATNRHLEEVDRKSDIKSMEEVLAMKPEVKDMEKKIVCVMEKPDVKEHIKTAEAHIAVEELLTVLSVDMGKVAKTTGKESEALVKKVKVEPPVKAPTEETNVMVDVEGATKKADAKVEVETPTEEVASKVDVEASTKETDTKVESMISEEMETSLDQAGGKLEKNVPGAVVDMESHMETSGAKVAEKKSEMETPAVNTDVKESTEQVIVESFPEKSEAEILTKIAEAEFLIEKIEVKVCVEGIAEKMDAGVDLKDPEKKVDEKDSAEQPEVPVKAEVTAEQLEKETLGKARENIVFQSDVEGSTSCLAKCVETVSAETSLDIDAEQESVTNAMPRLPMQTELPGVAISLESKVFDTAVTEMLSKSGGKVGVSALEEVSAVHAVTEEPKEGVLDGPSVSKEDMLDLSSAVVGDARLILKSKFPEEIKVDAPESKDKVSVIDVTLVESKSAKESIIQEEMHQIKTEEDALISLGTTASEGHTQSDKDDVFSLQSVYTKAAEDTVQTGATGNITEKELGKVHLSTALDTTELVTPDAVVDGSILSDSGYLNSKVSRAILESKRDITPLVNSEAIKIGITVLTEACPDKLPLEAEPPVLEHPAASDSSHQEQRLSEKLQLMEEAKSSENMKLAGGDVCHATSVPQEIFPEQQATVLIGIPEVPRCAADKPSETVTATVVDEQIIAEVVTPAELPTPIHQDIFPEQQTTVPIGIPEVPSCAADKPAETLTATAVEEQIIAEVVTPAELLTSVQQGIFPEQQATVLIGIPEVPSCAAADKPSETVTATVVDEQIIAEVVTHAELPAPVQQEIFPEKQATVPIGIPGVPHCAADKSSEIVTVTAVEEQIITEVVTPAELPTPVQQGIFPEQQATVLIGIPEVPHCAADKPSETVTATAVEKQIIAEVVTRAELPTPVQQEIFPEQQATLPIGIPEVPSCAADKPAETVTTTAVDKQIIAEVVTRAELPTPVHQEIFPEQQATVPIGIPEVPCCAADKPTETVTATAVDEQIIAEVVTCAELPTPVQPEIFPEQQATVPIGIPEVPCCAADKPAETVTATAVDEQIIAEVVTHAELPTPVQQEIFPEQQATVPIGIPEVPHCAADKPAETVTATAVEEQIIAEVVTPAQLPTPVEQDIFPEQQATVLIGIPEVPRCAADKPAETVTATAVEEQIIAEVVTPAQPPTPVQQDIFPEQQATVPIGIPEVPSCAADKPTETVTVTAVEEKIIAEVATPAELPTETLQHLPEERQETEFKLVQQVSVTPSVCETTGPVTEIMSEKIDSTIQQPVLPTVSCTKDDLLQKCVFHSIPEEKCQKPDTSQEVGKKTTPPDRSPSLTHIEFQKDVVQSVTIESQSTKIVLKIIQNAVDTLEETEEPVSLAKQQSESHLAGVHQSEIQTDLQIGPQPGIKGKKENVPEIQPLSITQPAEKQCAFKIVEEMPFHSEKSDDGESVGSSKIGTGPKAIKHTTHVDEQPCTVTTLAEHLGLLSEVTKEIINEKSLQKEYGEPKDTAVSTELQRATLESIVSGEVPKESFELDQPKLKDIEMGQTVQIQEQLSEKQKHVKRKDHSPLTESIESDVNNQDGTSCKSLQLQSELVES